MVSPAPPLHLSTNFDPQTGRPVAVAPEVARVTAPNSGPYTFTGTNSFIIGSERLAVVDPGPDDAGHLAALLAAIDGRPVEAIILTHTHRDHCELAEALKAATGAPLWFGGRHRLSREPYPFEDSAIANASNWTLAPDRVLRDRESVAVAGVALEVIATPGHCANHLAFGLAGTPFVFSGDHVMGWSSTLVAVPGGSMADYLRSLDRIIDAPFTHYLPAHGGDIADGRGYARELKAHREVRNRQVIEAVGAGARSIDDLLGLIYPGLNPQLQAAARMTLVAHAEYLGERGAIEVVRGEFGEMVLGLVG